MYICLLLKYDLLQYYDVLKYECIVIDNQQQIRFINLTSAYGVEVYDKDKSIGMLSTSILCTFPMWESTRSTKIQDISTCTRKNITFCNNFKYQGSYDYDPELHSPKTFDVVNSFRSNIVFEELNIK